MDPTATVLCTPSTQTTTSAMLDILCKLLSVKPFRRLPAFSDLNAAKKLSNRTVSSVMFYHCRHGPRSRETTFGITIPRDHLFRLRALLDNSENSLIELASNDFITKLHFLSFVLRHLSSDQLPSMIEPGFIPHTFTTLGWFRGCTGR